MKKHGKAAPEPPPPPPGLDARRGALEILERIRDGENLGDALLRSRAFNALEGADRSFARTMASATLRRRGGIDHLLGAYIDRPLPRKAVRVMDILRLASAQILILGTPDHAAVSTAVALCHERRETANYAKLVNAVARKIAKSGTSSLEKLPARIDTPAWMWRAWERAYGPMVARSIALAHHKEPPLDLTVKTTGDIEKWADALDGEMIAGNSLRRAGATDITKLEGFGDGEWWVQDVAASVPVRLFGALSGKTVVDLCAAPGGKTMQLAAAGANVTALDISAPRLAVVEENLARTKLKATLLEADMMKWKPPAPVDAVLLDAPCTATGTIRRHPDLPWLKSEDDIAALTGLQARMIDRALGFLKPGGMLIYCVCSLQPEEGEKQAEAALERNSGLQRMPVSADEIAPLPAEMITRNGDLRTLPSMLAEKGGMDGFFAVRFVRPA